MIILTPVTSFIIGIKKTKENKRKQNSQISLWASLFYEFKNDSGAAQSQFYTIFFIRRMTFIVILFVLIEYPMIQIYLFEILSIGVKFI